MFKLYNTKKELFYSDYKTLPNLEKLNYKELAQLLQNLYEALDNAFSYHSDILVCALYDDIVKVNTEKIIRDEYITSEKIEMVVQDDYKSMENN